MPLSSGGLGLSLVALVLLPLPVSSMTASTLRNFDSVFRDDGGCECLRGEIKDGGEMGPVTGGGVADLEREATGEDDDASSAHAELYSGKYPRLGLGIQVAFEGLAAISEGAISGVVPL